MWCGKISKTVCVCVGLRVKQLKPEGLGLIGIQAGAVSLAQSDTSIHNI